MRHEQSGAHTGSLLSLFSILTALTQVETAWWVLSALLPFGFPGYKCHNVGNTESVGTPQPIFTCIMVK